MMTLVRPRWLQVEQIGPVTVVTFPPGEILRITWLPVSATKICRSPQQLVG